MIGGSGTVGSMVLPHLAASHEIRVFDLKPPRSDLSLDYTAGDLRDYDKLRAAADGRDALVFMAMGPMAGWGSPDNAWSHFEVATGGLHNALRAAHEAGIGHAVYTSSMSVYGETGDTPYPDESVTPNATNFYGLAKRFGEQVCAAACSAYGMSLVALRFCFPTAEADWPRTDHPVKRILATSARDSARAIQAGLDRARQGHGFEAFGISGDTGKRRIDTTPARTVLGWEPLDPTP
ncbi:hypothetical protein GCM10027569_61740 [Flindersiella endophytica]